VAGSVGQPSAEVFQVAAVDGGDTGHGGCLFGEEGGQQTQGLVGVSDAAGAKDAPDLVEVAAHGRDHGGNDGGQVLPGG
jgi:hypothetical protein